MYAGYKNNMAIDLDTYKIDLPFVSLLLSLTYT